MPKKCKTVAHQRLANFQHVYKVLFLEILDEK
jgi:hypothetical protein